MLPEPEYRLENPRNTFNERERRKKSLLVKKKRSVLKEVLEKQSPLNKDGNKTFSKESMVEALAEINRKILSQCQVWQTLPTK